MDPVVLERDLTEFLAEARNAVVLEEGAVVFDLREAHYSVSGERARCLLHLWSNERNTVRRVLKAEQKNGTLRLTVQRFGKTKPQYLEVCRDRDHRPPAVRRLARSEYQNLLQRMLLRHFPDWKIGPLTSAMDLERSFGPVYSRGLIRKGHSSFAVLGVNAQESQSAIDGALTFGLLWLDYCREREAGSSVVKGLQLFLPQDRTALACARVSNLNHKLAEFHLLEVNEREQAFVEADVHDRGNVLTRLVRHPDETRIRDCHDESIRKVLETVPDAEVIVLSSSEIAFRLHGLEIARIRTLPSRDSFRKQCETVFGVGAHERVLDTSSQNLFSELMQRVRTARTPDGDTRDLLWRMYPERWLEEVVRKNLPRLNPAFDAGHIYVQVPAFAASDRVMIDVLTKTHDGRLAVLELKAEEDIHLPLQGLDYWARVNWHQQRGEFQQFGYFLDQHEKPVPLSAETPRLFLVAPALHIHPAVETVLRYFPPEVHWEFIALDERWRHDLRVVFRKKRSKTTTG